MHTLIFGVGRSGTKAVQLYLSYLFAEKNGSTWINYEPYFWLNRKTSIINYEGLYHHASSPNIATSPDQFSRRHRNFLQDLSKHPTDIVTKFIRGNGRIGAIRPLLDADLTIVIIRDLYQVLTSVLRTNWDFMSVGFEYKMNWDSFLHETAKSGLIDDMDWFTDRINDRLDRNAFYWYVMNLSSIEHSAEDIVFIDYNEIEKTESIAKVLFKRDDLPPISSPIFNGDYIHTDYPLISESQRYSTRELINGILYRTQLTDKYGVYITTKSVGEKVIINRDFQVIESPEPKATKLSIEKKEIYEFMNSDIAQKLAVRTRTVESAKHAI